MTDKKKRITKKFREETARSIIDSNAMDVPFSDEDTAKMNAILGTSHQRFVRRTNPLFHSDPRHLHAINGYQSIAFSWRNCIYPQSQKKRIIDVLRHAIKPDTDGFKEDVGHYICACKGCQKCQRIAEDAGCSVTKNLQTDHVHPSFDAIANEFISTHGEPEIVDGEHGILESFKDVEQEANWIKFHAQRAVYQLLCGPCNASKGKRPA